MGTDLGPVNIAPNENGYTVIGEVWSFGEALEGKESWNLALLSSSPLLPTLCSKETNLVSSFNIIETKKYYLPDRDFRMLRYTILFTHTHNGYVLLIAKLYAVMLLDLDFDFGHPELAGLFVYIHVHVCYIVIEQ